MDHTLDCHTIYALPSFPEQTSFWANLEIPLQAQPLVLESLLNQSTFQT